MTRELLKHERIFEYTGIWMDSLRGGAMGLTNTNKLVRFYPGANGMKAGNRVSIYTINGESVGSATASATGTVDIPLNGRGVYIVRTPEKSFKIIKK